MSETHSTAATPTVITNPPGATFLHYRVGDFASFRTALLMPLPGETELADWRPTAEGDLAVQLLEWWAYLADILTFYNEQIVNQSYMGTAVQDSLLQLTNLVGYQPPPSTAATGTVAAVLTAKSAATVPTGFALQSKPGPGQAPQVFEVDGAASLAPSTTGGVVAIDVSRATPIAERTDLLFDAPITGVAVGDIVMVAPTADVADPTKRLQSVQMYLQSASKRGATATPLVSPTAVAVRVSKLSTEKDPLGRSRYRATFEGLLTMPVSSPPSADTPERVAAPRSARAPAPDLPPTDVTEYSLLRTSQFAVPSTLVPPVEPRLETTLEERDALVIHLAAPLRTVQVGDVLVVEDAAGALHVMTLLAYAERWYPSPPSAVKREGEVLMAVVPHVQTPEPAQQPSVLYGVILLGGAWTTDPKQPSPVPAKIWHGFRGVPANAVDESPATLSAGDDTGSVTLRTVAQTDLGSGAVLAEGADLQGATLNVRAVDKAGGLALTAPPGQPDPPALQTPVTLYTNLVAISQGRTVRNEILGSGDATAIGQTFQLQKGPLTYHPVTGTTLTVTVDGSPWALAQSFYAQGPRARIYVVRHDAVQGTLIQFGDGVHGARLPTGRNNVTATYRYGTAGTAAAPVKAPLPGKLVTMLTPQPGIKSVRNPVALVEGTTGLSDDQIRSQAPTTVQHLDRAITAADYESIALTHGAGWARATIHWNRHRRTTAPIVYIADSTALSKVRAAIEAASPHSGVQVVAGRAVTVKIEIHLLVFPGNSPTKVEAAVRARLQAGVLSTSHEHLNRPPRSGEIRAACRDVEGVVSVRVDVHDSLSERDPGAFFPVNAEHISIHAEVDRHG